MKTHLVQFALTSIVVVALSACGGGGGGSTTPPVTTPSLTFQNIVNSIASFSYPSSVDSLAAASAVSSIRQGAGDGLLAQSNPLDQAANSHTAYLVNNSLVASSVYLTSTIGGELGAHYEVNTYPGYTGTTPQARATAAGYAGTVTENISFGTASGADCVTSQEDSVYHLAALLSPFINVGISFNAGNGTGSSCTIELGIPSTTLGQLPASGIVMYPYSGQVSVPPTFYNQAEIPNPATDLSSAGHPVAVSLYTQLTPSLSGSDIVIHTYSMTTGINPVSPVSARVLANSGVTSTGPTLTTDNAINGAGFVVLLPVAPLTPNTVYTVTFSATVKGTAVSKSWSFTTGNAN